jgi:hypothetical protein
MQAVLARDFMALPKSSVMSKNTHTSKGNSKAASNDTPLDSAALQPVDEGFLQRVQPGTHLFHYSRQGDAKTSFRKSPSAEYTMYSVIDVPTENDIVMSRSFDEKEKKKSYTWDDLLAGEWWYNPETLQRK